MKDALKENLPRPLLELALWTYSGGARLRDFISDYMRYSKFAMRSEDTVVGLTDKQLEAQITRDYHRVEKGLALKTPKRPFGAGLLRRLEALLPQALSRMPQANFVSAAVSAREALLKWNADASISDEVSPPGRTVPSSYAEVTDFFSSRHSVRDFDEKPVDRSLIHEAVRLAGLSPSVCNRQPWHVRLYHGAHASRILRYQNGNQGFGANVPTVALITVELSHFAGAHERNQAWIEGGIFSTSLMWALHGLGLSSCMLNLSIRASEAKRLRQAAGAADSEVPIMMIAIGHPRDGYRIARSPRRSSEQIIMDEK